MENQHRKIKGYRELSEDEIAMMNKIKLLGPKIEELINEMHSVGTNLHDDRDESSCVDFVDPLDHRWISIGKTHLQQGLMALTRAVAKPDFF